VLQVFTLLNLGTIINTQNGNLRQRRKITPIIRLKHKGRRTPRTVVAEIRSENVEIQFSKDQIVHLRNQTLHKCDRNRLNTPRPATGRAASGIYFVYRHLQLSLSLRVLQLLRLAPPM
jgi:hypothetical protein